VDTGFPQWIKRRYNRKDLVSDKKRCFGNVKQRKKIGRGKFNKFCIFLFHIKKYRIFIKTFLFVIKIVKFLNQE